MLSICLLLTKFHVEIPTVCALPKMIMIDGKMLKGKKLWCRISCCGSVMSTGSHVCIFGSIAKLFVFRSSQKKQKNMTSSLYYLCFSHCAWWGIWSKKKRHRTSDHFEVSLFFQVTVLTCREARKWPCPHWCFSNSVILHGVSPNIPTQCLEQKWALAAIDLFIPSQWMTSNAASGMPHDIQKKIKNLSSCVNETSVFPVAANSSAVQPNCTHGHMVLLLVLLSGTVKHL